MACGRATLRWASCFLEVPGRESFECLRHRIDDDSSAFQGKHSQDRLDTFGAEDDPPSCQTIHEAEDRKAVAELQQLTVGQLVATSAFATNAGCIQRA